MQTRNFKNEKPTGYNINQKGCQYHCHLDLIFVVQVFLIKNDGTTIEKTIENICCCLSLMKQQFFSENIGQKAKWYFDLLMALLSSKSTTKNRQLQIETQQCVERICKRPPKIKECKTIDTFVIFFIDNCGVNFFKIILKQAKQKTIHKLDL